MGILGQGPVQLTVRYAERTTQVLTELLGFRKKGSYPSHLDGQPDILVFETGEGGTGGRSTC